MITLKKGSQNKPQVSRLQAALDCAGKSVDIDGIFGANTERAVIDFQKEKGLQPDGIVGQATWGELEKYEQYEGEGCSG